MDALRESLAEAKAWYFAKFGSDLEDLEDEDEPLYDADGTQWQISVGRGLHEQRENYDVRLESLEHSLDEFGALYLGKFGKDLDLDDEGDYSCDAGGVSWVRTAASPAAVQKFACESKVDASQDSLAEVKTCTLPSSGSTWRTSRTTTSRSTMPRARPGT